MLLTPFSEALLSNHLRSRTCRVTNCITPRPGWSEDISSGTASRLATHHTSDGLSASRSGASPEFGDPRSS